MRIAYVVNSLEGGGAALPLPAVLGLLRDEGAQVDLLALAERDGRAAPPLRAAGFTPRTPPLRETGRLRSALWLERELAARRPDLIWTSLTQATVVGQLVGARLRVPVVSWQHNAHLKPANLHLLRATARLTSLWVADSAAVADLTATRLQTPREAVHVWPLFRAGAIAPAATPATGEVWRVGALGRLHPNKGFDVLVEALACLGRDHPAVLRGMEVVVAGEGGERATLEAAAARAGVPCRFPRLRGGPVGLPPRPAGLRAALAGGGAVHRRARGHGGGVAGRGLRRRRDGAHGGRCGRGDRGPLRRSRSPGRSPAPAAHRAGGLGRLRRARPGARERALQRRRLRTRRTRGATRR